MPDATPDDGDLRRLLDERAIEAVLVSYCRSVDDGAVADVVALFEEDATLDLMGRVAVGRAAIAEVFAVAAGPFDRPSTTHALSGIVIELDGAQATSTADLTVLSRTTDGSFQVTLCARYHDVLRRTDRWRLSSRRVVVHARPAAVPA